MKSILIVGVGGQGTLLASRILGNLALKLGFDVKMSEVHGMAQRGGSVVTHVRYGEKVDSPLVDLGKADYILAFERLEAIRAKEFLSETGTMIVNTQEIFPMPVILGNSKYPDADRLEKSDNIIELDALSLALKAGNTKAVNVVLMGVLASLLDISYDEWICTLKENIKEKFIDMNCTAFDLGYNYLKN